MADSGAATPLQPAGRFLSSVKKLFQPGALHNWCTAIVAMGQLCKAERNNGWCGRCFYVLACIAHLAMFAGILLWAWRAGGVLGHIVAVTGFGAWSMADKSIEYVWYKQQSPLLGAAAVWCVMAAIFGLIAVMATIVVGIGLTAGWLALQLLAHLCSCLERTNGAKGSCISHQWCLDQLEYVSEQLKEVCKLPDGL